VTLYTDEVKRIVKEIKAPYPNFIYDVVEYPRWLTLRMYRDNFELFSDPKRETLALWFGEQIARIQKTGIPCYAEVFATVPNRRSN
jgi:hypothetical protein